MQDKSCDLDCWSCKREGCPYTLKASSDLDSQIKRDRMTKEQKSNSDRCRKYYKKNREEILCKRKALTKQFRRRKTFAKSHYKRHYLEKHGEYPSEEQLIEWERKYYLKKGIAI